MTTLRWLLVLGLVACSGDDKGSDTGGTGDDDDDIAWDGDCEQAFSACGGDPSGDWTVVGVCEVALDDLAACAGLTYTILDDRSSGTVAMNGDNTYDRVYNLDLDFEIGIPLSCIAPVPCNLLPPASAGIFSTCTDDGTTCTCQGTFAETDSASGSWTVEGDEIVFDGDDRQQFCIDGDRATVQDEAGVRTNWVR
jgi:hypothetical protein